MSQTKEDKQYAADRKKYGNENRAKDDVDSRGSR
jgi:hypothetical protein